MTQASNKLQHIEEDTVSSSTTNKTGRFEFLRSVSLSQNRLLQTWALPIILFGLALAFNLYRLGAASIWFDEAFSVELARQPLPLLWHIIWGPEPNMEIYYLFLHAWLGFIALLGLHATEFVVRFPSAIFAALSSVVVFLLGRRFLGTTAGIVGASLYLLNDLQLVYAQQTRSYSLQLLLVCIAWYALFVAISGASRQKQWWICFIVASTLAVYAHLFSLVILVAQLLAFAGLMLLPGPWRDKTRRQLPALTVSLIVVGVFILPILIVSRNGPNTGWLPIPHLGDITHLFLTISGDSRIYLLVIAICCALGLLVALLAYFPGTNGLFNNIALGVSAGNKRQLLLSQFLSVGFALLCWLVVPVILSYIVSKGSTRLFSTRYLVIIVPPLFLLVGMGVAAIRWRGVQVALALVLFLLALYSVPLYYRSAQVEDWNTAVPWLQQHYQNGDGLVCYDSEVRQGCQVSVEYYLHAYPGAAPAAHFTDDSPGAFSWVQFGPVNPTAGPEAAVDPRALAIYGVKHARLFFIVARIPDDAAAARAKAAQSWLDSHYHFIDQIVTPTVTIRLYGTASTT